MTLPFRLPFPVMEAVASEDLPTGENWLYEPKWDGFRCLIFKDGSRVDLQSKSGRPLTRYFPEVAETAARLRPATLVLDTELVIEERDGTSFDDLLQRIHPAASRITKLAQARPACAVVSDILVDADGRLLIAEPLRVRRRRLERLASVFDHTPGFLLAPATRDIEEARRWLQDPRAALDGILAKRLDEPYRGGQRAAIRVKRKRTAYCVVGGYRLAPGGKTLGSVLLGLYDDEGLLHHVGFTATFRGPERERVLLRLQELGTGPGFSGRAPGGHAPWSERSAEWEPVAPTLVVEVEYERFGSGRFRHGTRFVCWRPDRDPRACTFADVETQNGVDFEALLGGEKTPAACR